MKTETDTQTELLADLVTEAVRGGIGAVGVLVRDVPAPDPRRMLEHLVSLNEEVESGIRVAYLREGGKEAAKELGLSDEMFSGEVEQAERWRNQRDLEALIVVIAHGEEAKLSSLEDFVAVTSRDLKGILVDRALGENAGLNEVQARWWRLLKDDDAVGLAQLADYYLSLADRDDEEFLAASSREIFRLGLLPDRELFDNPKEAAVKKRYAANRDLVRKLQTLTPKDRRTIAGVVDGEEDPETKRELREALDLLDRARWQGEGLQKIFFQAAERLLKARSQQKKKKSTSATEKATNVAAEALVDEAREEDIKTVVDAFIERLNELDDSQLRPETIKADLPDVGATATATARLDVINLMAKLLGDGVYGGLVDIEASNLEDALRRFNADHHVVERWGRDKIEEFLAYFKHTEAGEELASCFRRYDEARSHVLPLMRILAVEPLAVAAHRETRDHLLTLISTYEDMNQAVGRRYEELFQQFGTDAQAMLNHLLLLEIVVLQVGERLYAIAAPTHPLYVWHFARYGQAVDEQRGRLDEKDTELVTMAAGDLPNFLTSLFIPPAAIGTGINLPFLGRLDPSPLPYFGRDIETSASDDGVKSVKSLIEAHLAFEPYTRSGFRLALVDPPDAGTYLTLLADLAEEGEVTGAHLTVYRHPRRKHGVELRLDEAEEDRVAQFFRSLTAERRFTFEVVELATGSIGPPEGDPFHLVVVFDPSDGRQNPMRPAAQKIQPLALPRRIAYRHGYKTVELEPAPGEPFASYDKVVKRVTEGGGASYLSVHQDKALREKLEELSSRISWTAIADRHVDRDIGAGALRILTARDGERDVAAFSRSAASFRRPLRDVVRKYNAYISEEELDELLHQLSEILDTGLLMLRPDAAGKTDEARIKGLLGTLIAARWFRETGEGERLLISLDGEEARRWLHLSGDPLRADLVGFEWTDDHCTVSIIEVKAVQASSSEYQISDGFVEGPAIDQMLATRRLLESVFARDREDELVTTPARREILREHLYRELTKGSYTPDERRVWADRLQRLLEGEVIADLRCHLIDVRLGVDTATLQSRSVTARDAENAVPVEITELNERQVDQLTPPEAEVANESHAEPVVERAENGGKEEKKTEPPVTGESKEEPGVGARVEPEEAEIEAPQSSEATAESASERPRALLGTAPGTYGRERDIWFDPTRPNDKLPNPHVSITGETGSGKTQATKAIITDLQGHGVPALILDFKDDYSDTIYAEAEDLRVYDPGYEPLPFNPLTPQVDRRTGRVNPNHHIHQLTDIIKRIYGLGDQQAYHLREAIKRAYQTTSVPMEAFEPGEEQTYPPFEAVRVQLEHEKGNKALLGRLSPIFDLGLFAVADRETDFASVVNSGTVVRLAQLPGDETKNSVAEFFLMALYNYLTRQPQTHTLERLLVLDEAWRLVKSPFLEPLMREGRAFGLGVIIATQFPADLPTAVSGSTATKLFFSQTNIKEIREIQRTVVGKTSGGEADHLAGVLRGLAPLSCVLHSKQHRPFARLTLKPYFERHS